MDTTEALLACLPPQAYDRTAARVLAEAVAAAAPLDGAIQLAEDLLSEHQPQATETALQDWERNYALPDACIGGAGATLEQRRANLLARLPGRSNLSRAAIVAEAARLGFAGCTISEFGAFTCMDPCDQPVASSDFIGVWRLNVPVSTTIVDATCASPCDTPLRFWGNTQLECVINRRKPAHTVALFIYAP